jgi:DnaJ family protein C protein 8
MNLANEGLEAKKKEEEVLAKKRKAEEDASWEGSVATGPSHTAGSTDLPIFVTANREQRVGSWRTFSKDSKKKKKQKVNILG